jgi:hypothetical protein
MHLPGLRNVVSVVWVSYISDVHIQVRILVYGSVKQDTLGEESKDRVGEEFAANENTE